MRRLFFLSTGLLAAAAALAVLALHLLPPVITADAATRLTVLDHGTLRQTTMADWLPGVVAAEMPASFESEALKAQAVAARTFLLEHKNRRPTAHPEADVCDDPACCCAHSDETTLRENWGGDAGQNLRRVRTAVAETDGTVLTYQGEPILAAFHSSSAGQTEDSAALWGATPYLVSVSSPETAADVPNYVSEVKLTPEALRDAIQKERPEVAFPDAPEQWIGAVTPDESGRVGEIAIGSETFTGAELRSILQLRSAAFTAKYTDGKFTFTVTGYGHGVGMSQYGANVMAKQGSGCTEILAHYYPGTELVTPETEKHP